MSEPQTSFQHALFKAEWAYKHINDLDNFCKGFVAAKPYIVRADRNIDGIVVVHTGIAYDIPVQIPLLAGDAVHALRSALDYCWMGLERSCTSNSEKRTFPRGEDRKSLEVPVNLASKRWDLPQIEPFILDVIKPYKTGNHTLWALGALDNRDKHNLLVIALGKITFDRLSLVSADGSKLVADGMSLVIGTTMPFAAVGAAGDDFELDFEVSAPVEIVLREEGVIENVPIVPTLLDMAQTVRETVELFRKTFS